MKAMPVPWHAKGARNFSEFWKKVGGIPEKKIFTRGNKTVYVRKQKNYVRKRKYFNVAPGMTQRRLGTPCVTAAGGSVQGFRHRSPPCFTPNSGRRRASPPPPRGDWYTELSFHAKGRPPACSGHQTGPLPARPFSRHPPDHVLRQE